MVEQKINEISIIRSMMTYWDEIMAVVRAKCPEKTEEEHYQIAKSALSCMLKKEGKGK